MYTAYAKRTNASAIAAKMPRRIHVSLVGVIFMRRCAYIKSRATSRRLYMALFVVSK